MTETPFLESISFRTNKATRISREWQEEPSACSTSIAGGRNERKSKRLIDGWIKPWEHTRSQPDFTSFYTAAHQFGKNSPRRSSSSPEPCSHFVLLSATFLSSEGASDLSVFFFSSSRARRVCCRRSVRISSSWVSLYSSRNCSPSSTRSRVASCSGMSLRYSPRRVRSSRFMTLGKERGKGR